MRESLVARGLITPDGSLTDAGMAYTDVLMQELRGAEPPPAIQGARGPWRANGGLA